MKLFNKFLSFLPLFLILFFQISAPLEVLAQEVSPSPEPQATEQPVPADSPTPSSTPTETPTEQSSPSPTPDPSVTPFPDPSPESTPQPTPAVVQTPEPAPSDPRTIADKNPHPDQTHQPSSLDEHIGQPNAPPSATSSASPVPTKINGHLSATIIDNHSDTISNLRLDVNPANQTTSATLTTNKPDYSPTEAAVISGSGFNSNTSYTLTVTSDDPPTVNFETSVKTNVVGSFVYAYQLDGNYRPNYKVGLKNSQGIVVATITFTDAPPTQPDLTAAKSNNLGGGNATVGTSFNWTIHVANGGTATATFNRNDTILSDNLPTSGATYGSPSVITSGTTGTGTISCSISSNTLTCTATGANGSDKVNLPAGTSFDVVFSVTPSVSGSLTNPRSGGSCSVDPNTTISESNEGNNACSNGPITVVNPPDTTPPTAAGTPTTTTPNNNNKPTWNWTAATDNVGIDHYIFYWDTVAGGQTNNSGNIAAGTTSFTHSSSLTDGTWYGKVKAFDAAGNSSVSGNGSVVVDTTAPTTPVATPAAGDYLTAQSVTLSSSDTGGSGVASIYYTTDGTTPSNTNGTLYTVAISITKDTTLKAIAYDNAGNASLVFSGTYGIAPVISTQASNTVTSSSVTITWTTDNPATSRVIYDTVSHPGELGAAPNYGYANSTVEDGTKVLAHSVNISGLSAGTTYYYRSISHGSPEAVGSEKSFATSSPSSSGDGGGGGGGTGGGGGGGASTPSCGDSAAGGAPTLLSATATGSNQVTLTWSKALDPVTHYVISYGLTPGNPLYGNPSVGDKNTTSYTVSNLSGGTTYYFRVRAGNGCNGGPYSNELSITPGGAIISGPAAGFTPGVLGVATATEKQAATKSGEVQGESTPSSETKQTSEQSDFFASEKGKIILALLVLLGLGFLIFYFR